MCKIFVNDAFLFASNYALFSYYYMPNVISTLVYFLRLPACELRNMPESLLLYATYFHDALNKILYKLCFIFCIETV